MISLLEKEMAIEASKNFFEGTRGNLLFKILSNYLVNTTELKNILINVDDNIFSDEHKMKIYSKILISYMADVAMKPNSNITYTTGQLSKIFGVSITTINSWISKRRFIGLETKGKYKQSKISENVLWNNLNGELISIKEVAKMYKSQNIENVSEEEEQKILMSEIRFFENKYDGNYLNTLSKNEDKTDEELNDESEWTYLLNRVEKQL